MPSNYVFLGIFIVSPKCMASVIYMLWVRYSRAAILVYFWSLLASLDNQDSFRARKSTPNYNFPLSDLERRPGQSTSDLYSDKVRDHQKVRMLAAISLLMVLHLAAQFPRYDICRDNFGQEERPPNDR